ncbi:MAG TPA: hypothetical protein VGS13_05100 [Stellaceae bacterium]|nr:hypothetical protein [Stellaceae bacterium]
MIADWLTAMRPRLSLGWDQSGRFIRWVVALLVFIAALGGVGLVELHHRLRAWEHEFAAAAALQVPADVSNARLATVMALLRQTPGIQSVHLLDPAETARLLEPWLGPAVTLDELPVPRLIDLRIDPDGATDMAALRRQLATVAPDSRLDDHLSWPQGMHAAARRLESILAASTAAALMLIAVSVAFSVRATLVADRSVAQLLHRLGAGDGDIARLFAIRALRVGLEGGVIGAIAAVVAILALSGAGSLVRLPAPGEYHGVADWRIWAVLGGAAVAAGLIAMASAWAAVRRRLARMS